MQNIKPAIIALLALAFLYLPLTANAQQPRFESPEKIQRLCEQTYNPHRKAKDCSCFTEKYKAKEMEIFKQRGTGTVPPYDTVFRLIDNECHIHSEAGQEKLNACTQNPPAQGLNAAELDTFCKCMGKVATQLEEMLKLMSNATAAQKQQTADQMNVAAKNQCLHQSKRKYH